VLPFQFSDVGLSLIVIKNDLALIGDMVVGKSSKMKKLGEKLA
jgi:hypothetical protein